MSVTNSPNMNLPIPGVGTEIGPTYATDINNALTLVDSHDHSAGKGVQITPSGLNINTALPIGNNALTQIGSLLFQSQTMADTTNQSLSVAPGSGTGIADLFYTDGTGTTIQLTKSGIVNVVASSIPGESYSAGTFFWTQEQDGLPTTPANFDIGSVTIRPNVALTSNGVRLIPSASIASQYDITLPLLPAASKLVTLDNAGIVTAQTDVDNATLTIISNTIQVKNGGIGQTQLSASFAKWTSQTFTSSNTFNVPSGITRIFYLMVGGGGGGGGGGGSTSSTAGAGGGGGGAGQIVYGSSIVTPGDSLSITLGTGGSAGAGVSTNGGTSGSAGQPTTIDGTSLHVIAFGGGGGGAGRRGGGTNNNQPSQSGYLFAIGTNGADLIGGSNFGGGGAGGGSIIAGPDGASATPSTTAGTDGKNGSGGSGGSAGTPNGSAGGMGGRSIFVTTQALVGGAGGNAGGGGGGGSGLGVGGDGGPGGASPTAGTSAAANTGAGGGGGGGHTGGSNGAGASGGTGGSGKVIITYLGG